MRYVVDRAQGEGVRYRGHAHTKEVSIPLEVSVDTAGAVIARLDEHASLSGEDRREMEREAAALVRAALRSSATGGSGPRRIARWRA